MSDANSDQWTRRRLLRAIPAALTPLLIPQTLRAEASSGKADPPFSRFTDVAQDAGLSHTTVYGDPNHNTYIVEVNGAGCAFFDYDNDGWMDALILGARKLESIPPGAGNQPYPPNRARAFPPVTQKVGLSGLRSAYRAFVVGV